MSLEDLEVILLEGFTLRAPTDTAKVGLEVWHEGCGEHVCDAEATDTLGVLVLTALAHLDDCPAYQEDHRERMGELAAFVPPF